MEGNGLALAAVAEVLQKMDARLTKAGEEEKEDDDKKVEEAMLEAQIQGKTEIPEEITEQIEAADLPDRGSLLADTRPEPVPRPASLLGAT